VVAFPITESNIEAAQRLYRHEKMKNWQLSDLALERAKGDYPSNVDLVQVYLKASLLNGLYSTFLYYAVYDVADRIVKIFRTEPEIDGRTLVSRLSHDPIGGKRRLSFASKYAHFFHLQDQPPIFDRYAVLALATHLRRLESHYFKENDKYERYCDGIDELRSLSKFEMKPRELDRYLWLGGMWVDFKRGNYKINQEALSLFQSQETDCWAAFKPLEEGASCFS
jgi:hypothetical protein